MDWKALKITPVAFLSGLLFLLTSGQALAQPECYMGNLKEPYCNAWMSDLSGMEHTDRYWVYLDPYQCAECTDPGSIEYAYFEIYAYTSFDLSFNVGLYAAIDAGGGCYVPDPDTLICLEGPFSQSIAGEGFWELRSDLLTNACWSYLKQPMFLSIEWVVPPSYPDNDFVRDNEGCAPCLTYLDDPASPGTPIDFCGYPLWEDNTGEQLPGNPVIHVSRRCEELAPTATPTPTTTGPTPTPTTTPTITPTQVPECEMGNLKEPYCNAWMSDWSGMEHTDRYWVYLDPGQCVDCTEAGRIEYADFWIYTYGACNLSFNIGLYGAVDSGGGCYVPDPGNQICLEGPFSVSIPDDGFRVMSAPLNNPCWYYPMQPMFLSIEWIVPPDCLNDFVRDNDGCTDCLTYLDDPASPGTPIDFFAYPLWEEDMGEQLPGNPAIWASMRCAEIIPTATPTPTWDPSVPTYTPTATPTITNTPTITGTPTPSPECPFTEDFESGKVPDNGWSIQTAGVGVQWQASTDYSYTGTYSAYCSWVAADHDEWLITPPIDLTGWRDPVMSFW